MLELHSAAYYADCRELVSLLKQGHDPNQADDKGFTPLHWCCLRARVANQLPIASHLLEAGANPDASTIAGDTCLIWAVQAGSSELVAALLAAGADINLGSDGVTVLMQAARDGDEQLVELLLAHGADTSITTAGFDAAAYARHTGHETLAARLSNHRA